jgi:hypothetical protein
MPAAEAARPNSTGAASRRLQVAPAEYIFSRGKHRAAPVAASLKSGSRVNVERWADWHREPS